MSLALGNRFHYIKFGNIVNIGCCLAMHALQCLLACILNIKDNSGNRASLCNQCTTSQAVIKSRKSFDTIY